MPEKVSFETITYTQLLEQAGLRQPSGHQMPVAVRNFLNNNYTSFVWITHFPEHTRPFYVKCEAGFGYDCQLWYRGANYLAAGGERETDHDVARRKIVAEGKNPEDYRLYLECLEYGLPPLCSIGMGIERFLAAIIPQSANAEFSFMPVYEGRIHH